jgi:hypothetical protein
MPEAAYETRPLREDERDWLSEVLLEHWGRALIVGRGRVRQVKDQLWNASVQGNNAADRQPLPRQRGPVRELADSYYRIVQTPKAGTQTR